MSRKTGLILCRNPDYSVLDLPQDVSWIYASPNNSQTKFDYVANLDCYNDVIEAFLNNPTVYLKPSGVYIHVGGVKNALELLGLNLNSYRQLDVNTKTKIVNHFKALTSQLGFSRWHIPPVGRILSTDVYFYDPIQSSSFKLHQQPPTPPSASLDILPDDSIYEIARQTDYSGLEKLCKSSKRLQNLCSTDKFKTLSVDAWIKEYSSPEQALIEAARAGYADIVQQLMKKGVNAHTKDDQAFKGALYANKLPVIKLFLTDPTFTSNMYIIHDALTEAIKSSNISALKLLLPYGYKDPNPTDNEMMIRDLLQTARETSNFSINDLLLSRRDIRKVNDEFSLI